MVGLSTIHVNDVHQPWYMRLRNGIGHILYDLSWLLIAQFLFMPVATHAQEEVASAFLRYKDREASTGFYDQYEVLPRKTRPIIAIPGVGPGVFAYSPSAAQVRTRTRLADSHRGHQILQRAALRILPHRTDQRHPHDPSPAYMPAVPRRGTDCRYSILLLTNESRPPSCLCVRKMS